jgi:glycosyltransferase involved in cell wall biosynthesis
MADNCAAMATDISVAMNSNAEVTPAIQRRGPIAVGLLTGGQDPHYVFGLVTALVTRDVAFEIIGSDAIDCPEFHTTPGLTFLALRTNKQTAVGWAQKISRIAMYYARLFHYTWSCNPKIFHILWNNKFEYFDRTLLMLFYKSFGKKIVFTAHNVNQARRDGRDSALNRMTLRFQYRLSDHIFVHTDEMKRELRADFGVKERTVTVIPYGMNNAVPDTGLTSMDAKRQLGIGSDERTILFFGAIAPYKGLDILLEAFQAIAARDPRYRLIIAGKPKGGCGEYLKSMQETIRRQGNEGRVIQNIGYIADEEVEIYFKAGDVLALPYREIFQSGILFLGYSFGLPVIAADVGSFREDIVEGRTGYLSKPEDAGDLAEKIEKYFASDLYKNLAEWRLAIKNEAQARHSWNAVGEMTRDVYGELLGAQLPGKEALGRS